ncbi:YihY/virulence factor BrkB family protein [Flavobacterium sp. I3-2]|uniref:YihY/virulence factor BrkB family protein n=1 Tax=Flavobacterium sp. I3-2 TaxID=2748319 RepID=UPI0015B1B47E|nr:YihY/virulence factor BrkB family protein [Flavobacterium sp. I3-2]
MNLKDKLFYKLFIKSVNDFFEEECLKFSASLTYYTIFALPSFAIILITFLGYFLGEEEVSGNLFRQINRMVGNQASSQIQEIINNSKLTKTSIIETIIGVITLLFSASGMFGEIQSSINDIWKIKAKNRKGMIKAVIDQFFSFSMIAVFGFILAVSLLIDSFIDVLYDKIAKVVNIEKLLIADYLDSFLVFLIITFIIVYVFKELPDAVIKFKDAFIGALFTAILFMIGKWVIGEYLENSDKFTLYGTAGSILILLLWIYYSAIILYFGAVFTKNYALIYGNSIVPNEYSDFKE